MSEDMDFGTYSFGLEFDGVVISHITEISGLKIEQDVIEVKRNNAVGQSDNVKIPGRPKSGEVTLTRNHSGNNSFEKWIKDAHLGKMSGARKTGAIIMYRADGTEARRYNLIGAWAKSLEISGLKAGATEPATEKLVVTYDRAEVQG